MLKDWDYMEIYGTEPLKMYQVSDAEEEKTVIRVVAGDVGYEKEFENPNDPLMRRIIKFCEGARFTELDKKKNIESFFK
jgi:hypothetical protein